jgi:hypothetical protein
MLTEAVLGRRMIYAWAMAALAAISGHLVCDFLKGTWTDNRCRLASSALPRISN